MYTSYSALLDNGESYLVDYEDGASSLRMFRPITSDPLDGDFYVYAIPLEAEMDLRLAMVEETSAIIALPEIRYEFDGDDLMTIRQ